MTQRSFVFAAAAVAALAGSLPFAASAQAQTQPVTKVPVVFSGGHDTDGRDRGRPVVLIAAALGVPEGVFREAFTHVRPAQAGTAPEAGQVRDNKAALMSALRPYGVSNEKLDRVSNYYRYVRSRNQLWPVKPAVANALVQNGVVTGYEVVSGGSGYTSPPTVTVPNVTAAPVTAKLAFGTVLESNGSVSALVSAPKAKTP